MSKYWSFKIEADKVPQYKHNMLKKDLELFREELKVKVFETLDTLKNDRSLIMKAAKKNAFAGTILAGVETNFEVMTNMIDQVELLEFKFHSYEDYIEIEVRVLNEYFEMWKTLKQNSRLFRAMPTKFTDQKGIIKFFKNNMASYSKDVTITPKDI